MTGRTRKGARRWLAHGFAASLLVAAGTVGATAAAVPASAATTTINCDTAAQPSTDWTSCQKLVGTAKCVWNNKDGTYTLAMGYTNPTAYTLFASVPSASVPAIVNGGFESPTVASNYQFVGSHNSPSPATGIAWDTTDSTKVVEIWHTGYLGVPADTGTQFAELNANNVGTLSQDLATTPGFTLNWSLAHRGRSGTDTMTVSIGPPVGPLVVQTPYGQSVPNISDGTSAWGHYHGQYTIPAGQTTTRFAFNSVSAAGGDNSIGNFLDSVVFSLAGTNNTITGTAGSAANPGQPDTFYPGTSTTAFTYTWKPGSATDPVTWALMGNTVSWADTITACPSKPVPVIGNGIAASTGVIAIMSFSLMNRRRFRGLLAATRLNATPSSL